MCINFKIVHRVCLRVSVSFLVPNQKDTQNRHLPTLCTKKFFAAAADFGLAAIMTV